MIHGEKPIGLVEVERVFLILSAGKDDFLDGIASSRL